LAFVELKKREIEQQCTSIMLEEERREHGREPSLRNGPTSEAKRAKKMLNWQRWIVAAPGR